MPRGADRNLLSLRLLAEVPRDVGPPLELWILHLASAAEVDSWSLRPSRDTKAGPLWQTPGEDATEHRGSIPSLGRPSILAMNSGDGLNTTLRGSTGV